MAIFMELRCELRAEQPGNESRCWSDDNSGPWSMALNTHKSTAETTTEIFAMAESAGWKCINGDWICPGCQEYRAKAEQKQAESNNPSGHGK